MVFDSKMNFKKDLCSVSRAAYQSLESLGCPDEYSMIAPLEMFALVYPTRIKYCSALWCSDADTHLKLLYRVVSVARFLTGCV